jgi:hypothetical protein
MGRPFWFGIVRYEKSVNEKKINRRRFAGLRKVKT